MKLSFAAPIAVKVRQVRGRLQSPMLAILLVATFAVTATMGYRAYVAERMHRRATERILRDAADFGAWLYAVVASNRLTAVMSAAFAPVAGSTVADSLPSLGAFALAVRRADQCDAKDERRGRFAFRADVASGGIRFAGERPSARVASWLAGTVVPHARDAVPTQGYGVAFDGSGLPVAYELVRDRAGRPAAVYGFASCALSGETSVFEQVAAERIVFPRAVTGALPDDSVFTVRVSAPGGAVLYESAAGLDSGYRASESLPGAVATTGIVASVALRPAVIEAMRRRPGQSPLLPSLALLFVGCAALVGATIVVYRRERRLVAERQRFVSDVSHELRTPLAQIRMFGELLRLGRLRSDADRDRALAIIDQEARRLGNLVDNVLHVARRERTGEVRALVPTAQEVGPRVADTVSAFRPLAAARHVDVDLSGVQDGVWAYLDGAAFHQVLLNVLDNAVKYGPDGQHVRLSVWEDRRRGRAIVTVDDEGPGIAPRDRERVWRAFERLHDGPGLVTGSGLGLAVVRDLVRGLGGQAWLERAPSGGARVVIEVPSAPPRADSVTVSDEYAVAMPVATERSAVAWSTFTENGTTGVSGTGPAS